MKDYEIKIIIELLKMASDEFSNHGCNDFNLKGIEDLSEEERISIWKDQMLYWGENPEEYTFNGYTNDSSLMGMFADKLKKYLKEKV